MVQLYLESAALTKSANPYLQVFLAQKTAIDNSDRLFDPELDEETRERMYNAVDSSMAEMYSWAIPDECALTIIKEFGPIVEMGAGRGYWARLLEIRGVDVISYDIDIDAEKKYWMNVQKGTPEVLSKHSDRSLMLCYPDDYEDGEESMALKCLDNYTGDTIIHIGEVFGHTVCLPSPWGRTSGPDFQERLASVYHKVLQVPLPSWSSSVDTLSVWRRTKTCIVDDSIYAYIPSEERLELTMTSESTRHLVDSTNKRKRGD